MLWNSLVTWLADIKLNVIIYGVPSIWYNDSRNISLFVTHVNSVSSYLPTFLSLRVMFSVNRMQYNISDLFPNLKHGLPKLTTQSLASSWRRSLSYRNESIDLLCKSMDWFLYDRALRHERIKKSWEWNILPMANWKELRKKLLCSHFEKKGWKNFSDNDLDEKGENSS